MYLSISIIKSLKQLSSRDTIPLIRPGGGGGGAGPGGVVNANIQREDAWSSVMAVARWRLPSLSLLSLLLLPLSTSTPNPTLYLLNIQKDYVFPKKDALNATKTVSEPAKDGGASSKDYSEGGASRDVVVSAEDFSLQSTKQPKGGENT
jgi:hypothetical protein